MRIFCPESCLQGMSALPRCPRCSSIFSLAWKKQYSFVMCYVLPALLGNRNICAFRIINVLSLKKKVRLLAKKWWGKPYNNTQSKFKTGFCLTSLSLSNCVENSSYKSDYSIFSFASFSTDTFFLPRKKNKESFQESITCDESKLGQHTTIKAVSQTFWKAISKVLSYAGKESTLHTEAKCSVNVNILWSIWSKSFMW